MPDQLENSSTGTSPSSSAVDSTTNTDKNNLQPDASQNASALPPQTPQPVSNTTASSENSGVAAGLPMSNISSAKQMLETLEIENEAGINQDLITMSADEVESKVVEMTKTWELAHQLDKELHQSNDYWVIRFKKRTVVIVLGVGVIILWLIPLIRWVWNR